MWIDPASLSRRWTPRHVTVQELVEWAFSREMAQLEWPEDVPAEERGGGYGIEYVLLRQAQLGCRVDGGGRSLPHHDADVVAAVLAGLPRELGGRGMAIRTAELARARSTPDWMPHAEPRCVPAEWKQTKHGWRGASETVRVDRVLSRGRWRDVDIRWCPIAWDPHPRRIDAARRAYGEWIMVLRWLRDTLKAGRVLSDHALLDPLPPACPWAPRRRH